MTHPHRTSSIVTAITTIAVLWLMPSKAAAQGFISPFVGFNYGGDSGCRTATGCDDTHSNFGVSGGKLAAIAGAEFDLGYASDFFGDAPGAENSVLTIMANVIVGPKIAAVRPYVLGGLGLIKTHVEFTTGSILDSSNNFGWDIGGGVMLMFGGHVGVRGDVRRFKSFQDLNILGFGLANVGLANEKISFNRATLGLVLAF